MSEDLKILVRQRGAIKTRVTLFEKYLETTKLIPQSNFTKQSLSELQLKSSRFQELLGEFDKIQNKIENICDNLDEQIVERESIENSFIKLISLSQSIIESHLPPIEKDRSSLGSGHTINSKCSNKCNASSQLANCNIKLPTIQLPIFDGSYIKWMEFRDTFDSLINNNVSIPPINKFHYLRSSLEGGASVVIKSIEFTASNYQVAWDLLCERFNNERILVNNHIKSMFNFEAITKESHKSLRYMIDYYSKNLRALSTLKEPTQHWDTLIIYMMASKLDGATSRKWEENKSHLKTSPSLNDFFQFLRNRADVLETLQYTTQKSNQQAYAKNTQQRNVKTFVSSTSEKTYNCVFCKQNHCNHECTKFKELSVKDRQSEVSRHNLCKNCLRPGHHITRCRLGPCKFCHKKHNSLLHLNEQPSTTEPLRPSNPVNEINHVTATPVSLSSVTQYQVLLCTAEVELINISNNKIMRAKALLDSGSQSSFLMESVKEKLSLNTQQSETVSISGINNSKSSTTELCNIRIKSRVDSYTADVSCLIIPKITSMLPSVEIDTTQFKMPSNIQLADPSYFRPSEVQILLGADIYWEIVNSKQIKLGRNKPTLQDSKLGWLVAGPTGGSSGATTHCHFSREIRETLNKFWEIEDIPSQQKMLTKDEEFCESYFVETTKRLSNGRFSVMLPLRDFPQDVLGDSYNIAKRRFYNLEQKLAKNNMKGDYAEFIHEYERLGHLVEIQRPHFGYYIPHHAVLRENSETTKLRVVFDASCKTTSKVSLNDIQMVGPVVQDDLLSILLRFRQHTYVVTGDVEKMYRQVMVDESQRHLQLILWRDKESEPLKIFQLNTVTYGTAAAAFLSTRCLVQLADECTDEIIANTIRHDFYVDDLNTGSDSKSILTSTIKGVISKLNEACFPLRKFRTNAIDIFSDMSVTNETQDFCKQSTVLGLKWSPTNDTLQFTSDYENIIKVTKRSILSNSCKVFDPLGILSACTIFHKILLQKLWLTKLDWDDAVPDNLATSWREFIQESKHFSELQIPRHALCHEPVSIEIHCFTDASKDAYAACIYLKSINKKGNVSVHLLSAKAKVAPLKPEMTIPRLELMGALLGARLHTKVQQALKFTASRSVFWTDSTIILGWLQTQPKTLKIFVCNRINDIREMTDVNAWRHVPTDSNPADLASRGVKPSLLINNKLWWQGPCFLSGPETGWPTVRPGETSLPETITHSLTVQCIQGVLPFNKYSNLHTLQRVSAYVLRFINNCKKHTTNMYNDLSVPELRNSLTILGKVAQRESFEKDITSLKNDKVLHRKSKLLGLNPFFDDQDILRVGGRIDNAPHCSYEKRHPILIDGKHIFSKLLFEAEHIRQLHCGPQHLLNTTRECFWATGGRTLATSTVNKCVRCQRFKIKLTKPIMGDLPTPRVTPAPPFETCGTDFAGPFLIANKKGRGAKVSKCYLCVFVCFSTKAVHLEVVSDLSTNGFIMCLRRFIARRGKPHSIYCDNGKNFVGAKNELNRMFKVCKRQITESACGEGIVFHFSPAYAPNFGGIWEASVKSAKHHLKRIAGNCSLTFEELTTLFAQIEAVMNSRPLTPLSAVPSDLEPLTPGHFLIGRALTSLPAPVAEKLSINRFERIQQLRQHFWSRWTKDYLSSLQQRAKWKTTQGKLEIDDIVLIIDEQLPPLKWRLGRVVKLYPGKDGLTRVVELNTKNGIIKRAVCKLSPLEGI